MPETPTQKEYWSGKVGGEWATHADRIDIMMQSMTGHALDLAAFEPGEHVLDIGCGAGATSLEIARRVVPGGSVTGVDLSPQLLDVARARAAEAALPASFIEADAGAAHFDQTFDAAFSRFGVMFFEQPTKAFAHIRAALRPDGRLVFLCWRPFAENQWSTTAIEAIKPMLKELLAPPNPDAPGPFALADRDKIVRVLGEAGWRDLEITRWDGDIPVGGGGSLRETADFLIRIGPTARAIADQDLDSAEARIRLMDALAPFETKSGVMLGVACWVVRARA
ncbi:MAG TPA: class I SAM-dependent methyltransferase [Vitreimonas sp.]|uniref:class I SAM-dependent methyltransferase n=1 Tax=Vitreimonas sp. TaxID=3069702 RepID=UPI002D5DED54|nr:class I SAM-dependent methyltransferase [Vitreimonas sp.]HYD89435.1 class I SAM-dependent methyltransferase [Vitreimonas sp.]